MIDLDSPRWHELRDAYERAGHVPGVLRRLAEGDDGAWGELYDAFALVYRGEISEAAFASVPHLERLARQLPLLDRYEHIVLAGRVAYIGRENCDWMAEDVRAPCLAAFAKLNDDAGRLLPELAESHAYEIAKAILAFERCYAVHDAVDGIAGGELDVRCPGDTCGVTLRLVPRGDGLVGAVAYEPGEADATDTVESRVEGSPPIAFDTGASWTDRDALPRLVARATAHGPHPMTCRLDGLSGTIACPKCGERFSILDEILHPTEL